MGTLLTELNKSDVEVFKELSTGGRFGKYGDDRRVKGVRPGYVTDIHRNAPEIWGDIGTIMAFLGVKSFV